MCPANGQGFKKWDWRARVLGGSQESVVLRPLTWSFLPWNIHRTLELKEPSQIQLLPSYRWENRPREGKRSRQRHTLTYKPRLRRSHLLELGATGLVFSRSDHEGSIARALPFTHPFPRDGMKAHKRYIFISTSNSLSITLNLNCRLTNRVGAPCWVSMTVRFQLPGSTFPIGSVVFD